MSFRRALAWTLLAAQALAFAHVSAVAHSDAVEVHALVMDHASLAQTPELHAHNDFTRLHSEERCAAVDAVTTAHVGAVFAKAVAARFAQHGAVSRPAHSSGPPLSPLTLAPKASPPQV